MTIRFIIATLTIGLLSILQLEAQQSDIRVYTATNAKLKAGKQLQKGYYIQPDDIIKLKKDGYLSIYHKSESYFRYSGDTVLTGQGIINDILEESLFQVVAHKNVSLLSGSPIANMTTPNLDESIELRNGYILLGHPSGRLIEFSGDTVIVMRQLAEAYSDALWYPYDDWYSFVCEFSFLYDQEKPFQRDLFGSTPHYYEEIDIIYPKSENTVSDLSKNCLFVGWRWEEGSFADSVMNFKVVVKNIFDELIDSTIAINNSIELNITDFIKSDSLEYPIVIEVCSPDGTFCSQELLKTENFPNQCEYLSGLQALEEAMKLEMLGILNAAYKHYQLAAETSESKLYDEFLENFKLRNNYQ